MKRAGFIFMIMAVLWGTLGTAEAASFLEDEAGISASIMMTGVDLALAETAFKNIEKKTASYIIGSVAINGYDEQYDVHVYVDASGHLVAYYLKSEPASKIIDWINYAGGPMTLAGCKLEDALTTVCDAMSLSLPAVTYYDFRYPGAQQIKIVTDEEPVNNATETFNILIPGSHTLFSCTWSHAVSNNYNFTNYSANYTLSIDSLTINSQGYHPKGWYFWEGEISGDNLALDEVHEFSIYQYNADPTVSYAGIVLIYSETP